MTDIETCAGAPRPGAPAAPTAPESAARGSTPPTSAAPEIAVRLFAGAAAELGADAMTVRARTAGELVEALTTGATAEAARVISRSSLLVDGVACTDLHRELAPGTRVDVLPPFAGG